jgi:hypothetical protein
LSACTSTAVSSSPTTPSLPSSSTIGDFDLLLALSDPFGADTFRLIRWRLGPPSGDVPDGPASTSTSVGSPFAGFGGETLGLVFALTLREDGEGRTTLRLGAVGAAAGPGEGDVRRLRLIEGVASSTGVISQVYVRGGGM